jgi:hypothetical protein
MVGESKDKILDFSPLLLRLLLFFSSDDAADVLSFQNDLGEAASSEE